MTVRAFRRSITAAALLVTLTGGVAVAVTSTHSSTNGHTSVVRVDGGTPKPTPTPTASTDNTIWD
ncbi:hypothetical protein ACIOC1_24745 [Streptomyces sp. NPDC088197]|uniref:hypothetical protein n=1 Tax=unclassified Streptomyces TaxID=2593676 RepID=UPI001661979C|nr:hypothetical protein [Streptomyces sp. CBMA29]MBD0736265.1 hypothetical protein [Streptomyces sp. CBMA29]